MSTRDRILDAAADVMSTTGLAQTTTKKIAAAAGLSEAALYMHFKGKTELFMGVLAERMPSFKDLLGTLPDRAGQQTVAANLADVARAALAFYHRSFPMVAALFAEPKLLRAHHEAQRGEGADPRDANRHLTAYLEAEAKLGRAADDVDADAVAALLLGGCLLHAFLDHLSGAEDDEAARDAAAMQLAEAVARAVRP